MEPNQGVVVGDLRVLVTRTGAALHHTSLFDLVRQLAVGAGWKVTVSPVDSAQVLAERQVGRRRIAESIRSEFIRHATEQRLDRTDAATIQRLLEV